MVGNAKIFIAKENVLAAVLGETSIDPELHQPLFAPGYQHKYL